VVLGRALAYLYGAGAVLAAISLALPHPARQNELGLGMIIAGALVCCATVWVVAAKLPRWAFPAGAALGSAMITGAVYYAGEGSTAFAMYYIWAGLYTFYFFSRRLAFAEVALAAAAYAAVLEWGVPAEDAVGRWLVTTGTVIVAGTFVARLSEAVRERAAEAARRAEHLHEAERRTRAILETANEAFIAMDAAGHVAAWNPEAEQTFGWSHSEALGQPLFDLIVPEPLRPAYRSALADFLATGQSSMLNRRVELLAVHRDGHEFSTEVSIAPLAVGDTFVFNAFLRDITARKDAEVELRARAEDMAIVARVAQELSSVVDATAARGAICEAALDVAACKVAILFEPDPRGRELVSTSVAGVRAGRIRLPFTGQSSGAGAAFTSGQPFFVPDLEGHPSVFQTTRQELDVVSAIWQPVLRNGVSVGVLAVAWEQRVPELSERLRTLLSLMAAEAAVAIERADILTRLEAVARTDELTGLANRRAWEEQLPRELARAARERQGLCVAMVDLDRFKQYNDERGHQAGDRFLKQLAAGWRELLRPSDTLARYGGEEFVVLLPNCPLDRALDVAERLRQALPEEETCSAGVACWDGQEDAELLVSRADDALYRAKHEGRDRTIVAT